MEFIGCSVFVDCGTFGVYQGKVANVDATSLSLTLTNVMKDGEFVPGKHVLHSAEINDIKVLRMGTPRDQNPPRQSKTVASRFIAKNSSNEPVSVQSSSKSPSVKTEETQKVSNEKLNGSKLGSNSEQNNVNLTDNGKKIMQQLLLAPVSHPSSELKEEKQNAKSVQSKIIPQPTTNPVQTSTSVAAVDMCLPKMSSFQKENQKPKQSPMVPTAAIKILKRGEPFPLQKLSSVNGSQQLAANKNQPEAVEFEPEKRITNTAAASNEQKKKRNNRRSKKSESDKSQPSSETVAELSEESLSLDRTHSSTTVHAQSSATDKSETSIIFDSENADSVNNAPTPVPGGFKFDPLLLISSVASPTVAVISPNKVLTSTPNKIVPHRSLSVNDSPVWKPQYDKFGDMKKFTQKRAGNDQSIQKPEYEKFGDFKKFTEKQAPTPCNLNSNNLRSRGNTSSPSGVPAKDFVNGYGKVHKRNRELDGPIDHNAFKDDFDFSGNLALMVREEDEDDSTGDSFEPPAHIRNYRNDENILSDSSRVTSWTSTIHEFEHSAFANTKDGLKIPILTVSEKKKFLNIVAKSLGNDVFNISIADRLISTVLEIIAKNSIKVQNVVVIGSSETNVILLNRLAMHLSNRKYHSYFVNCSSQIRLSNIELVNEDRIKSVVQNIQIVILLENISNKLEIAWLNRVALGKDSAHIISLEQDFSQFPQSHSLYLGTLVESNSQKTKYQPERVVVDLCIPFTWFKEDASNALCEAFSKSTIISI